MATSSITDLDAKVDVPVSALLNAAAAFYALGELALSVMGGSSGDEQPNVGRIPARDLLIAAGLAQITYDGDDYTLGSDEAWDLINERSGRILAGMLTDIASRMTAQANLLLGDAEAVA